MGTLNWTSCLITLGRLHLRPLQQHFHSMGLTNWFTPLCIWSLAPCSGSGMISPSLLLEFLSSHFRRILLSLWMPLLRVGVPIWEISRFRAPYQLPGAQAGNVSSASLGSSARGPPGDGCCSQQYSHVLYQQVGEHTPTLCFV